MTLGCGMRAGDLLRQAERELAQKTHELDRLAQEMGEQVRAPKLTVAFSQSSCI